MELLVRSEQRHSPRTRYAAGDFRLYYPRKVRDTGKRMNFPGFGSARVAESLSEPDKRRLCVDVTQARHGERRFGVNVWADKEHIDSQIRTLREDDTAKLDDLQAQIEQCEATLRQLRMTKARTLHEAFGRGHKVTVKALTEAATEAEAARAVVG